MSYMVCITLGGDRVISYLEGLPIHPYIVWGTGLYGSSSRVQA
jgi:hypothetical protein